MTEAGWIALMLMFAALCVEIYLKRMWRSLARRLQVHIKEQAEAIEGALVAVGNVKRTIEVLKGQPNRRLYMSECGHDFGSASEWPETLEDRP